MAPRKSTSGSARATHTAEMAQPQASSSKTKLNDIPPPDLPDSLTPDYRAGQRTRVPLSDDERAALVHELIGFSPVEPLLNVEENARRKLYATVAKVDAYLRTKVDSEVMDREIDIGTYQLETILESSIDKSFDKFTAWTLRNAFDVPPELDVVLPWQRGLDFDRAVHVTKMLKGQEGLSEQVEDLRDKVEQARLLSYRLALAEKQIDRRLEIARQRKAEVGFVKEVLAASNLLPLPPKAQQVRSALSALHENVASLDAPTTVPDTLPPGTKAWEMGRQAYLNWAVGKIIHAEGKDETMDAAEEAMERGGGQEGLDQLSKAMGA